MPVTPWLGLALLVVAAWAAAAALRKAGVAGSAVVGGLAIGILLGPAILGRASPHFFEDAFIGARPEREAWRAIERERTAWELASARAAAMAPMAAIDRATAPPDVRAVDGAARDAACAEAERAWRDAARRARQPLTAAAFLLAAATLATAGAVRGIRSGVRSTSDAQPPRAPAISIGLWAAGLPAAIALAVLFGQGRSLVDASALCLVAAVAVGPWRMEEVDRNAADAAELGGAALLRAAGRASTAAAAIALAVAASLAWREGAAIGGVVAPVAMAAMAAMAASSGMVRLPRATLRRDATTPDIDDRIEPLLIPPLTALAVLPTELFLDARWMVMLVLALSAGDGRWLGACIGALLSGRRAPSAAARLVLPTAACSQTTVACCAIGLHAQLLPADLGLGLLAGAALAAATPSLRRRVDQGLGEVGGHRSDRGKN